MPRTPARSPARPDPTALPDPLRLPWRPPATPVPGPAPGPRAAPDPRAEAGWAAALPEAGAADRRLIEAQIGRDVRGSVAVASRCRYGLPVVVRTAPLLPDGTPFPTLYWLACPAARVAVGRLEAAGWNALLSERVAAEPELAAAHAAAHASYLAQRDAMAPLPGDPGVGGLPGRVKCLHALYAHQAATGADPVGRIVSQVVDPIDCPGPCVNPTRRGPTATHPVPRRVPRWGSVAQRPMECSGLSTAPGSERAAGRARRRHQLDPAAGGRRRRGRDRGRARPGDGHHPARQGGRPHRALRPGGAGPHPGGARGLRRHLPATRRGAPAPGGDQRDQGRGRPPGVPGRRPRPARRGAPRC